MDLFVGFFYILACIGGVLIGLLPILLPLCFIASLIGVLLPGGRR